jgi:phage terminase small subunit
MPVLLNVRHELVAQNLAKGMKNAAAYKAAGFKPNSKSAGKLCCAPHITARVAELMEIAVANTTLDATRVLGELEKIGFSNMLDFIRITDEGQPVLDFSTLTRDQAAAIAEITTDELTNPRTGEITKRTKFKLLDKKAALDSIGRHLGMFVERKDIRVGGVMFHVNASDDAL